MRGLFWWVPCFLWHRWVVRKSVRSIFTIRIPREPELAPEWEDMPGERCWEVCGRCGAERVRHVLDSGVSETLDVDAAEKAKLEEGWG